jgi:gas vesicle protein
MLRLIMGGVIGAGLAYYLDSRSGEQRRKKLSEQLDQVDLDQLREDVKATWASVSDDDFNRAKGNLKSLGSTIQVKTGDGIDSILARLRSLVEDAPTQAKVPSY